MSVDCSLPIRIIRDVVERTGLSQLANIAAEYKEDQSPVTAVDALVESIVAEHLRRELGNDFLLVGEETSSTLVPTIGEMRAAPLLMMIDGIDGTTEFVQHVNQGKHNPQWTLALTAVYEREAAGRFRPLLSFAYQGHSDCLFAYCDGQAVLIERPLAEARQCAFDISISPRDKPRGSIDVYLPKPECPHAMKEEFASQYGPSGYNMASLLASCAVGRPPTHNVPVNFTTFHYNLWDFGLWPMLNALGFATADYQDLGRTYDELRLELWGADHVRPTKILRPLVIAPPDVLPQLAGALTLRGASA
jgi:3'-phosphoadenosine 5'-phosphosulfate (PAPS) 3'-phosphatase